MSVSPPKETAEQTDANEDNNSESMDRGEEVQAREAYDFEVKEQDRWLPIANVARIMKTALPDNAKIAKEAKECMQECVSEFISFITSEASEKCQQEKRKTVNGEDILFAMTSTGFENYAEALKIYLAKYREFQSQSQRGDNPNQRPGSGYGAAAGQATATGPSAVGGSEPTAVTGYQGQEEGVNSILSPHGLDPSQQQGGAYAAYPPSATNNGVGGDHY
ncbi:hypothetical protein MMC21_000375 [Puttea exsequens]|nr:hypothetical protein [Puttea exsequens]